MEELLSQLQTHLVTTISGAVTTGILWLARSLVRAKQDVDIAHQKIRNIETKFKELQEHWKKQETFYANVVSANHREIRVSTFKRGRRKKGGPDYNQSS
jgi:septal ring factor EnvC (AmiA/AmiB activator)